MLSWLPPAEENYPNRGNQYQHADDLEWQIVVGEKQAPDVPHIVRSRYRQRRKGLSCRSKVSDDNADLNQQNYGNANAAYAGEPVDPASFFGADIEQHDDKKEKHHYGARVHQHLNNADEKGIKRHQQR